MTDLHVPPVLTGTPTYGDTETHRILQSMLDFARLVFGAPAASVFTYLEASDELQFEASSGVGGAALSGTRMPATAGIAGMVIQTGMATIASELASNAQFNRDVAAASGYTPDSICAAPLLYDDHVLGVIEVLDPDLGRFDSLEVMTIVEALADQVAASLYVLRELRTFRLHHGSGPKGRISSLVATLPDAAFDGGRSGILEAILAELSRSYA
jgi:GAF domain-containing protein